MPFTIRPLASQSQMTAVLSMKVCARTLRGRIRLNERPRSLRRRKFSWKIFPLEVRSCPKSCPFQGRVTKKGAIRAAIRRRIPTSCFQKRSAAHTPMEQQPSEVTFRRRLGRDRGENFSLPYGVADCATPPVSKRRLRSGPNLHPGDTHHCADGLFARDKHLVHDSANARSLVLFLARPRAGAAGVETCMEQKP